MPGPKTRLHPDLMMTIFIPADESGTATVARHEHGTPPLETMTLLELGLLLTTAHIQGHCVERAAVSASGVTLTITHRALVAYRLDHPYGINKQVTP